MKHGTNRLFLLLAMLGLAMACGDDNTKNSSNNVNNTNNINNTNNTNQNTTGSNNQNNTNNPDPSLACNPPAELEAVDHELWTNDQCTPLNSNPDSGRIYSSTEELLEDVDCVENADPGIDFSTHRLAYVVVDSNPDIGLRGVVEDENGAIKIYTASPQYCGGAAPPNSGLYVLVPADEREIVHAPCVYGECNFENNNAPPGSR